jgi:hypothetical protein
MRACTPTFSGTSSGWVQLFLSAEIMTAQSTIMVDLENYIADDTGTVWMDDVSITQEQTPISVFMPYPNFKGMMFDDQSQTAVFTVVPTPTQGTIPTDATLTDYRIDGTVSTGSSCTGGKTVLTGSWSIPATLPANGVIAALDFSGLAESTQYNVSFQMTHIADGVNASSNNPYPCYAVYKYPASTRTGFQVAVDQYQRVLLNGTPTFILGVYDSGGSMYLSQSQWETAYDQNLRLFSLPVNVYLNYTFGAQLNNSASLLLADLQSHGAWYVQTDNCSGAVTEQQNYFFWASADNADVQARASMPGFFGVYRADECVSSSAAGTFALKARTDSLAPGSITWGALLAGPSLSLWRDTLDLIATDPYPFYGAGPYSLGEVSSGTLAERSAVQSSRPIATVIQTFQGTGNAIWPTQADLRNMSYMAIAEGANGLFYWSIGRYGGGLWGYQNNHGAISSVTKGKPTTVHMIVQHFLGTGTHNVVIAGATGDWAALNGAAVAATTVDNYTFTLPIDSTSFSGAFNGYIGVTGWPPDWTNFQDMTVTTGNPTLLAFGGAPHQFTTGDLAWFTLGSGGWGELAGNYPVTVIDSNHVSIAVNTTGFPAFSGEIIDLWPSYRLDYYTRLQNVMNEIAGLQTVLASLDDNRKLIGNTQQSAGLHTRVKTGTGGKYYLIATNTSGNTLTPTFTWADPIAGSITVYNEGYSVTPSGATFTDSFGPYAAHVYELTDSRRTGE